MFFDIDWFNLRGFYFLDMKGVDEYLVVVKIL